MEDSELTWRYARAFSLALLFFALAIYVNAKSRLTGVARWELEVEAPWLAKALVALSIIPDFSIYEVRERGGLL